METNDIKKLDENVVNRIAAGEIIQRPANALKELIENSLDAKSTVIQITVKSGGLKFLQIQDNGTGIRADDLGIVCERFTTSKLRRFGDLKQIVTHGFRGEALASISHVANLTILTKTADKQCGYKCDYEDGKPKSEPRACACNQGTTITITDIFYNMPQRRQALKSPNDELLHIIDIVSKYAVHNVTVSFVLKKSDDPPIVKTNARSTREQTIRAIYGKNIAQELLSAQLTDEVHRCRMTVLTTTIKYSARKLALLLFVNNRSVDSPVIRAVISNLYKTYLPKGMHPFVYMSLDLEPANVDVNVHPTKHEVHMLYEDEIALQIKLAVEAQLLAHPKTRDFYKQRSLAKETTLLQSSVERVQAKDTIRTDSKEQKLDKFFTQPHQLSGSQQQQLSRQSGRAVVGYAPHKVRLTSVLQMRARIENACAADLQRLLKESVFVGANGVDFALFQHDAKLHLCRYREMSEELFYQRLVYSFGNFPAIILSPAISLRELLSLAVASQGESQEKRLQFAERGAGLLIKQAPILRAYFGIRITTDGKLEALPRLLHQHTPNMTFLPRYLLALVTQVQWVTEEGCLETFCRQTAKFYATVSAAQAKRQPDAHKWLVEQVIFAALKHYLLPPLHLKANLYELTNLPKLYRVFERC